MRYEDFSDVLNRRIFEQSKAKLLESIAGSPGRYVGLFRPTRPQAKLAQSLLQSHEIRMGDALEEIVEGYLGENGFAVLQKSVMVGGERKELDLHFSRGGEFFFAEMKIRDDHDSTKKTGQISDFEAKVRALAETYGGENLYAMLFFVDPALNKNRKFYLKRMADIRRDSGARVNLFYGREFFDHLIPGADVWAEMESHLKRWRDGIPDFPEINFDKNPAASAGEMESLTKGKAPVFRKIFGNEEVRREILPILFPTGEALRALKGRIQDYAARKMVEEYLNSR